MKSSCVQQPNNNHYIQVNKWQIEFFCQNQCPAFLLSHFKVWYAWQFNHDERYSRANNIAGFHGDEIMLASSSIPFIISGRNQLRLINRATRSRNISSDLSWMSWSVFLSFRCIIAGQLIA